jgi:hypothetical protein
MGDGQIKRFCSSEWCFLIGQNKFLSNKSGLFSIF